MERDVTSLLAIPPAAISAVAAGLQITQQRGGATAPWVPTPEQIEAWRALSTGEWLYIAKARQVGITTAVELDDVLWTAANDAAGNRVRCGLVVHTFDKTRERAVLAAQFCDQLQLSPKSATSERIVFANGSELEFVTAGAKGSGRSGSYQRLHLSELPFWPSNDDTFGALMPTLSLGAQCIIETTIDITGPSGALARDLWRDNNRFRKLFQPVEAHSSYRHDESAISDAEWTEMQGEGFTVRAAAAWWLREAVADLCHGDSLRAMREYPQRPEHMFQAARGRWVVRTPEVREPIRRTRMGGHVVDVFRECDSVVIGVDTAAGKGGDSSAIAVLDRWTGELVASLVDNTITTQDLAAVVAGCAVQWPAHVIIVEDNGIGQGTVDGIRARGVEVITQTTTQHTKYEGLLASKRAIEAGTVSGPSSLAAETDECHRDARGEFKGRKDLLMACGFALLWLNANPVAKPKPKPRADVIDVDAMLRSMRPARKSAW